MSDGSRPALYIYLFRTAWLGRPFWCNGDQAAGRGASIISVRRGDRRHPKEFVAPRRRDRRTVRA